MAVLPTMHIPPTSPGSTPAPRHMARTMLSSWAQMRSLSSPALELVAAFMRLMMSEPKMAWAFRPVVEARAWPSGPTSWACTLVVPKSTATPRRFPLWSDSALEAIPARSCGEPQSAAAEGSFSRGADPAGALSGQHAGQADALADLPNCSRTLFRPGQGVPGWRRRR